MPPCKGTTFFGDMQYGVEWILTFIMHMSPAVHSAVFVFCKYRIDIL